ncbi:MarR family winged helix-turn-helix transcriptional regulator [Desulfosediminicola sp.]|uniref:MarR family winged helix-turn-helix transcriptional regulator n=1 Tax=Desulfosediminicola sp. TaxID=2886825 RepID=UPI003AF2E2A5
MKYIDKQPFGFYIAMLFRLSRTNIEPLARTLGLTGSQIPFMASIFKSPGISQDEISAVHYIDKAATARQLSKLEESDFIVRKTDPANRRKKQVFPTEHALSKEAEFWQMLSESNQRSLDGLSQQECQQFTELLAKALHNQIHYYQKTQ